MLNLALVFSALIPAFQGEAGSTPVDPKLQIEASVKGAFAYATEGERQATVQRLWTLWSEFPEGDLKARALKKVTDFCSMSTSGFPDDKPFRDLRSEFPNLPDHSIPTAYYQRAYELTERQITFELRNALRAPSVDASVRNANKKAITDLYETARSTLLSLADGEAAKTAINNAVDTKRDGVLFASQDAFHGYERTLSEREAADVLAALQSNASTIQVIRLDGPPGTPKVRRGAARQPAKESDISRVLSAMNLITQTLVPERIAQHEAGKQLILDVGTWWKSLNPADTAQYESIWRKRREGNRPKAAPITQPKEASADDPDQGASNMKQNNASGSSQTTDSLGPSNAKWFVVAGLLLVASFITVVLVRRRQVRSAD